MSRIARASDVDIVEIGYPASDKDDAAGRTWGRPHKGQVQFEALSNDIQLFVAGYGTGKTTALARKLLLSMMHNHNSQSLVIAPTHRHCETVYRAMMEMLLAAEKRHGSARLVRRHKRSRGQAEIVLPNGSTCKFFSGVNKDGWMGESPSTVALDELEWNDDPAEIYGLVLHRLRERTRSGINLIRRRQILIASTAQWLTGVLRDKIAEADAQKQMALDAERKGQLYVPRIGYVVCPSTAAIGYGLEKETVDLWAEQMDPRTFRRAVLCDLTPPPEIVFAGCIGPRNIIDWKFDPNLKSFFLCDWGLHTSHWLFCQWSPTHNALVVFREWGPGPSSPADVGASIAAMLKCAAEHGLVDAHGFPRSAGAFECLGDPTTNPGVSYNNTRADHPLAAEADRILRGMRWRYGFPKEHRKRDKHYQITLLRMLLSPPKSNNNGNPRILFDRGLVTGRTATAQRLTNFGIWRSLTEELKFRRLPSGLMTEKIDKTKGWDHCFDALAFGAVMLFYQEFDLMFHQEHGLLSGAAAWHR